MKLFVKYIMLLLPTLSSGQIDISSIDSLARIQANTFLLNSESNYVLLFEHGCIDCEVEETCFCDFGDTEIFLITELNEICKFNCCNNNVGSINSASNILLKESYVTKKHFTNTFKYDYFESHSDYFRVELISIDTILSIQFPSFLFNDDYEHKEYNLKQNPKLLLDELIILTREESNIKWEKEVNYR